MIKDLPETLHKDLKKVARLEGRSLNGYIIKLLEQSAEERARRRRMRQGWAEYQKFMAALPRLGDSAALVRKDRDSDHGHERG